MGIEINGIAHIQLTVNSSISIEFWRALCSFMSMSTLLDNDDVHYSIGGHTGVLVRLAPEEKRSTSFDQDTVGLHHVCFRVGGAGAGGAFQPATSCVLDCCLEVGRLDIGS